MVESINEGGSAQERANSERANDEELCNGVKQEEQIQSARVTLEQSFGQMRTTADSPSLRETEHSGIDLGSIGSRRLRAEDTLTYTEGDEEVVVLDVLGNQRPANPSSNSASLNIQDQPDSLIGEEQQDISEQGDRNLELEEDEDSDSGEGSPLVQRELRNFMGWAQ